MKKTESVQHKERPKNSTKIGKSTRHTEGPLNSKAAQRSKQSKKKGGQRNGKLTKSEKKRTQICMTTPAEGLGLAARRRNGQGGRNYFPSGELKKIKIRQSPKAFQEGKIAKGVDPMGRTQKLKLNE